MARDADRGLYKRGSVWWAWVGGQRVSTRCRAKEAARAARAELERRHADPAYRAAHATTLAAACGAMIDAARLRHAPDATIRYRMQKSAHLVRLLGRDTVLADLTRDMVRRYVATREAEGASQHTVHKELATLRVALRGQKREGHYPGDIESVTLSREYSPGYVPRKTWLTLEQVDRLCRALGDERADWVRFIICTGARLSEAAHARPEDVTERAIALRGTKTAEAARTAVVADMFAHLWPVALPLRPWGNINRDLRVACRHAGVPRVSPNDLRRSTASILHQAGVPLDVLRHLLGHATTTMLQRVYGQMSTDALAVAINRTVSTQPTTENVVSSGESDDNARTSKPRVAGSSPAGRAAETPTNPGELRECAPGERCRRIPRNDAGGWREPYSFDTAWHDRLPDGVTVDEVLADLAPRAA